jgi:hypothetical protein
MTTTQHRTRSPAGPWWPVLLLLAASCGDARKPPRTATADAGDSASDTSAKELESLRRRNASLEREVKELKKTLSATAPGVPLPGPAPTPAPIPSATQAASPWTAAKLWVDDVMQVQDAAKRATAIEAIRRALTDPAPEQVAAALLAIPQIAQVNYDRSGLRELVLRHAQSPDEAVRSAFPFALLNVGEPQPGDVDLVLPLTSDASAFVRGSAGRSLTFFTKGDLTGRTGERVLALMNDTDRQVRRDVLGSVWGSQVSPQIEAKLLSEFASPDVETRRVVFYFGLSALRTKSPAVVDACIAALESNDRELQARARWGLARGVPDDQRSKVGDSYLKVLNLRTDPQLEQDAFEYLRLNGNESHAAGLDHLAENRLLTDSARTGARAAAAAIRARSPR